MLSVERRVANDGIPYTLNEFLGYYMLDERNKRNIAMLHGTIGTVAIRSGSIAVSAHSVPPAVGLMQVRSENIWSTFQFDTPLLEVIH